MVLKFAFAVNNDHSFDNRFFGEADKFLVYKLINGKIEFEGEIKNKREVREKDLTESNLKTDAIFKDLVANDIKVIVSKDFGKNLKLVNEYFIPVRVISDDLKHVINEIDNHLHWIVDELNNFSSGYKLFTIKSGILKTVID
jgi:predicted Fe-Mo cluster-binding NifX family protein